MASRGPTTGSGTGGASTWPFRSGDNGAPPEPGTERLPESPGRRPSDSPREAPGLHRPRLSTVPAEGPQRGTAVGAVTGCPQAPPRQAERTSRAAP